MNLLRKLNFIVFCLCLLSTSTVFSSSIQKKLDSLDIDLQIRAQEDPSFDRFLSEQSQQKQLEKEAAIQARVERAIEKEQKERIRIRFSQQQKERAKLENAQQLKLEQEHLQSLNHEKKTQQKLHKAFVAEKRDERSLQLQNTRELIARMQDRLVRSPASALPEKRPRVKKSNRFTLYEKIKLKNKRR